MHFSRKESLNFAASDLIISQSHLDHFQILRGGFRASCARMSQSARTTSWSEMPGTVIQERTRPGLLVQKRSKTLCSLVQSLVCCSRLLSTKISRILSQIERCWAPTGTLLVSQFISLALKSPPEKLSHQGCYEHIGICDLGTLRVHQVGR